MFLQTNKLLNQVANKQSITSENYYSIYSANKNKLVCWFLHWLVRAREWLASQLELGLLS
jgi:hypothetical protein